MTCEADVGECRMIGLHIGTFDDPDAYLPDRHGRHEERIAWFEVADRLPRYRGGAFGDEEPYRYGPATEGPSSDR